MFSPLFIVLFISLLLLLVIALIILIKRIKPQGMLKKFLILSGASVVGFVVFVLLHNLISALLGTIFNKEIDEPIFFLLAVFVCPAGLIVGVMGSIIQLIKERHKF